MRIEKFLVDMGFGTRKEVKQLIQQGHVQINYQLCRKSGIQLNPLTDQVFVGQQLVPYQKYHYVLLNKPAGVISATEDAYHRTVIDWLGEAYVNIELFPVGRLDLDTTGLLLLTNNGQLAHQLLSPKKKVSKRYQATIAGIVSESDVAQFEAGLDLGDFITQSAQLTVLATDRNQSRTEIEVVIHEGKFHQVKRMFEAVGKSVLRLHRVAMGPLVLEDTLAIGEWRTLTEAEQQALAPYGLSLI